MRKINNIVVHCSATREGHALTPEALEAEHRRRGFRTTGYHYYIRRDGTVLGTRSLELRPQQAFRRHLLRGWTGCHGESERYPHPGAAFGTPAAGTPAAEAVPECPCLRPPRPESGFGRGRNGAATGVGEAVPVLRG